MTLAEIFRSGHRELIDENPIEVMITRVERVRQGGGFREETSHVGIVRGRVHQAATGARSERTEITTPGIVHVEERWGFICETEMQQVNAETGDPVLEAGTPVMIPTEIRAGAHVVDSFTDPTTGTKYSIRSVAPCMDENVVWGWQATLEAVKDG